jgi:hypothetical protein
LHLADFEWSVMQPLLPTRVGGVQMAKSFEWQLLAVAHGGTNSLHQAKAPNRRPGLAASISTS